MPSLSTAPLTRRFFGAVVAIHLTACGGDPGAGTPPGEAPPGDPGGSQEGRFRADAAAPSDGAIHAAASAEGADVLPGIETCLDGFDNDADRRIDEGCFCEPGATQACFGGSAEQAGIGRCRTGEQRCEDGGEFATWGPCNGWVASVAEQCNDLDDDCDALIDEGCTSAATTVRRATYIKASHPDPDDAFGSRVALSADTLAVGACGDDSAAAGIDGDPGDDSAEDSGAVHVFRRAGDTWVQEAYIKASNTEPGPGGGAGFGCSVALWGDTLAVGAPRESSAATGIDRDQADRSATHSGAVYIFSRAGDTWTPQAYIKASNTDNGDAFGASLALSGDTLAVGAPEEASAATGVNGDQTDNSVPGEGAVYVFTRAADTWTQQAYIKADNTGDLENHFGFSVALSGDTLAVGSRPTLVTTTSQGRGVRIFVRSGATWSQQTRIAGSGAHNNDWFGESLSLSGDTLAVTAHGEDLPSQDEGLVYGSRGAVYVYVRAGAAWSEHARLAWDQEHALPAVALHGDRLVTATSVEVPGAATEATWIGHELIRVFERSRETWAQQLRLQPTESGDAVGFFHSPSIALHGTTLVVGTAGDDASAIGVGGDPLAPRTRTDSGAVWIYELGDAPGDP